MVNSFTLSSNPKDVRYLNVDTRVRGYGPNRLKALEMEGRWVLSPDSIPFITEAFKQIERLNGPGGMPELADCYKNATGQHNWTSESQLNNYPVHESSEFVEPGRESIRRSVTMQRSPRSQSVQAHSPSLNIGRRSESPLPLPPLPAIQTDLPHRTHGYGPAHQYKRSSPTEQYVLPRSQSISPRSVTEAINQDRPYQHRGTHSPTPSYSEFEHELLSADWRQRLKHVNQDRLKQEKLSRSPSLSPLKSELLNFDKARLKNPLYKSSWQCKLFTNSLKTMSSDPTSSLLITGKPSASQREVNSTVELMCMGQASAHAYATIHQRAIKRTEIKADIIRMDEEEEPDNKSEGSTVASDDTTVRLNSTDGWADDDEAEKLRLTEKFRNVNELEMGIISLQREMGLLMSPIGKKPEEKVKEEVKKPERKLSKLINPLEPIIERWTMEKRPILHWTVKEQAKEYRLHNSEMIMNGLRNEAMTTQQIEDLPVISPKEEDKKKPEPTIDHQQPSKIQQFLIKSRFVKKVKKNQTKPLTAKPSKNVKHNDDTISNQQQQDLSTKPAHKSIQEREDTIEKTPFITIQSWPIPKATKHRSKTVRIKKEEKIDKSNEHENIKESKSSEIRPETWMKIQQEFGTLPLELQQQLGLFMQSQIKEEGEIAEKSQIDNKPPNHQQNILEEIHQQNILEESHQKAPKETLPRHRQSFHQNPIEALQSRFMQEIESRPSKAKVKSVDRILLTQAILADLNNKDTEDEKVEEKKSSSIGGMMKRLLTQKKAKRKTKTVVKDPRIDSINERRKSSRTETPSMSSYGSFANTASLHGQIKSRREISIKTEDSASEHRIPERSKKESREESGELSTNQGSQNDEMISQLLKLREANVIDNSTLIQILQQQEGEERKKNMAADFKEVNESPINQRKIGYQVLHQQKHEEDNQHKNITSRQEVNESPINQRKNMASNPRSNTKEEVNERPMINKRQSKPNLNEISTNLQRSPTKRNQPQMGTKLADYFDTQLQVPEHLKLLLPDVKRKGSLSSQNSSSQRSNQDPHYHRIGDLNRQNDSQRLDDMELRREFGKLEDIDYGKERDVVNHPKKQPEDLNESIQQFIDQQKYLQRQSISNQQKHNEPPYPLNSTIYSLKKAPCPISNHPSIKALQLHHHQMPGSMHLVRNTRPSSTVYSSQSRSLTNPDESGRSSTIHSLNKRRLASQKQGRKEEKTRTFSQRVKGHLSDAIFHMSGTPLVHQSVRERNRLFSRRDKKNRRSEVSSRYLREVQVEDEGEYARVDIATDFFNNTNDADSISDRPILRMSRQQSMQLLTPHHLESAELENGLRMKLDHLFNEDQWVLIKEKSTLIRQRDEYSDMTQVLIYCTKVPGQGAEDPGYYSSYSYASSNQQSPHSPVKQTDYNRAPHRTQPISEVNHRYSSSYDTDYDDSILRRANSMANLGRDRYNADRRIRWALPTKHEYRKRHTSNDSLFSPGTNRQHFYEPIYDKDGLEHLTQYQGDFKKRLPGGRTPIEHFRWP